MARRFSANTAAPIAEKCNSATIGQCGWIDVLAVDANKLVNQLRVNRKPVGNMIPNSIKEFDRRHQRRVAIAKSLQDSNLQFLAKLESQFFGMDRT